MPSLEEKVAFLREPGAYPDRPRTVEVIETHMSFVFLTPRLVYKLKKPVRTSFLDFSTLERRHFYCLEEVRLNRRLAPTVYRGVVPLAVDSRGALALVTRGERGGRIVDWLVESSRLPRERMLDVLIRQGAAGAPELRALGLRLAGFYAGAPIVALPPREYLARLEALVDENHRVLARPELGGDPEQARAWHQGLHALLRERREWLLARAREGRIVEGHGDLRPEHVCLLSPPVVIDCLEFNRRLREVDPVDELAYLDLECERLGAAHAGRVVLERYLRGAGDRVAPGLVALYKAVRAHLRARLCLAHLDDHPSPERARHWREETARYLGIGERYLELARPGGV